jgi:hypothetical protein
VAVNDVALPVTLLEAFRISFPKQDLIALAFEWEAVVDSGVNEYSMFVDVHRTELGDPLEMRGGDSAYL